MCPRRPRLPECAAPDPHSGEPGRYEQWGGKIDSYENLVGQMGRATVGYVDPNALATWVSGVFGDEELAGAIRAEGEKAEYYALTVEPIKELIQTRLAQSREVVASAKGE